MLADAESVPVRGGIARPAPAKIVVGVAIFVGGFVLAFEVSSFGLQAVSLRVPLFIAAGVIVFGAGLHKVLWAPPRDKASYSPAARWIISAVLAVFLSTTITIAGVLLVALALLGGGR